MFSIVLAGFELFACDLEQPVGLVGEARQFGLFIGGRDVAGLIFVVIVMDELAVLVHSDASDVHRVGR